MPINNVPWRCSESSSRIRRRASSKRPTRWSKRVGSRRDRGAGVRPTDDLEALDLRAHGYWGHSSRLSSLRPSLPRSSCRKPKEKCCSKSRADVIGGQVRSDSQRFCSDRLGRTNHENRGLSLRDCPLFYGDQSLVRPAALALREALASVTAARFG